MVFNLCKPISFKYTSKKDEKSTFTQLPHEAEDSYAVHSTDLNDIEAVKRKAYDDKRARQAEEYLAKYGFAGVSGGGVIRGLR